MEGIRESSYRAMQGKEWISQFRSLRTFRKLRLKAVDFTHKEMVRTFQGNHNGRQP